ncbi:MAG: hypothetical protein ACRY3E_01780 [Candidatus Lariskella arthropodorum]
MQNVGAQHCTSESYKEVITPPTLTFGYHCLGLPAFKDFNESISYIKRHDDKKEGLKLWKKDTGYYRRLRIELILPVLSGLLADILLPNAILKKQIEMIIKVSTLNLLKKDFILISSKAS